MEEKSDINFNIILLGKAGSGKGTQAKFLEKEYNLHHISTGDVMRRHVKENTKYGKLIKQYQEEGKLVPDDTTIEILKEEIKLIKSQNKNLNGFIFDGFPRTAEQAKLLGNIIDLNRTYVVDFKVSDKTAIKRIQNRAQLDGDNARKDDKNPEAIQKRLNIYNKNNKKISKVLCRMSVLPQINIYANKKSPKEISLELSSAISKLGEAYKENILKK